MSVMLTSSVHQLWQTGCLDDSYHHQHKMGGRRYANFVVERVSIKEVHKGGENNLEEGIVLANMLFGIKQIY